MAAIWQLDQRSAMGNRRSNTKLDVDGQDGSSPAGAPRIVLIHALLESIAPAHAALKAEWPGAIVHDLLDTALLDDALAGASKPRDMENHMSLLLNVAFQGAPLHRPTRGVLFTCSAFGQAIDATWAAFKLPIVNPTEAAIHAALDYGKDIVAVVSTAVATDGLRNDFERYAGAHNPGARLHVLAADGALAALRQQRREAHDEALLREIAQAGTADAILLPQFSTAHVAIAARQKTTTPIVTAPQAAVRSLRDQIATQHDATKCLTRAP